MNIRPYKNKTPTIDKSSYIDPQCCIIGDVTIGSNCSVWPMTVIRGDVNSIVIGDGTNIQDGSVLHVSHRGPYGKGAPLIIGQQVTIGHKALLHACTIGDYCLVGMGSIVLDNAILQPYVLLGAGSLVPANKTLESGHLYLGSPAKKIRALTIEEKEFLQYSAEHYVLLTQDYKN